MLLPFDAREQLPPLRQGHMPQTVFLVALHAVNTASPAEQFEHGLHTFPWMAEPLRQFPAGHCTPVTQEPLYKYKLLLQSVHCHGLVHCRQFVAHVESQTRVEMYNCEVEQLGNVTSPAGDQMEQNVPVETPRLPLV